MRTVWSDEFHSKSIQPPGAHKIQFARHVGSVFDPDVIASILLRFGRDVRTRGTGEPTSFAHATRTRPHSRVRRTHLYSCTISNARWKSIVLPDLPATWLVWLAPGSEGRHRPNQQTPRGIHQQLLATLQKDIHNLDQSINVVQRGLFWCWR